jgi:hypothetical protein
MRKIGAAYILAIAFLIVSLMWFLWVKNIGMGIVWLAAAILEFIVAVVCRSK